MVKLKERNRKKKKEEKRAFVLKQFFLCFLWKSHLNPTTVAECSFMTFSLNLVFLHLTALFLAISPYVSLNISFLSSVVYNVRDT